MPRPFGRAPDAISRTAPHIGTPFRDTDNGKVRSASGRKPWDGTCSPAKDASPLETVPRNRAIPSIRPTICTCEPSWHCRFRRTQVKASKSESVSPLGVGADPIPQGLQGQGPAHRYNLVSKRTAKERVRSRTSEINPPWSGVGIVLHVPGLDSRALVVASVK